MRSNEFTIALSERDQEEAIKEVSLKIKAVFPKRINCLIILFTPNYNPSAILKTLNFTLQPQKVLGLQSPLLIFEGKIIQKGIVACCINKEQMEWKEAYLAGTESQEIDSFLSSSLKDIKGKGFYHLSFACAQFNPFTYINRMNMSLGKVFNLRGAGFTKQYSEFPPQIINSSLNQGLVNVSIRGLQIDYLKLGGYLPIGKPFTITKAASGRGIINEINGLPAIDIYKQYLQEKFSVFAKNHLFSFYPLGVEADGTLRLISIINHLEDGSLACIGEVRQGSQGYIMFLDSDLLLKNLKNTLGTLENPEGGFVFMLNSLIRRKILRENSEAEIKLTKQILGDKVKIIGLYSDYSFFSDAQKGDIDIESGNAIITLWK